MSSCDISYQAPAGLDQETLDLLDQTLYDTEALIADEMKLQEDWMALQEALAALDSQSDTALITVVMSIMPLIAQVLDDAMFCLVDAWNISSDCSNLLISAQNDYMAMVDGADEVDEEGNSTYTTGAADATSFMETLNLFTTTEFTITYTDDDGKKTTATSTGLLDLLTKDSDEADDEWMTIGGGCAEAPMSTQTADTIALSIDDIENTIGEEYFADPETYGQTVYEEIQEWVVPSDTAEGDVAEVSPEIDQINSDIDQSTSAMATASQAQQAQIQNLNNEQQEFYSIWSDMNDSLTSQMTYMVQNQLS